MAQLKILKVAPHLHAIFKAKAAAHGLSLQEAVRRALLAFLRAPKQEWSS